MPSPRKVVDTDLSFLMNPAFSLPCVTGALLSLLLAEDPALAQNASQAPVQTLILATVQDSTPAMRSDGQKIIMPRPGYRAELVQQAARQCNATATFTLAPWQRALYLVENNAVDGVFVASYTAERAAYAVYPLKSGSPDPTKAIKGYTYSLFVRVDVPMSWDGRNVGGRDRRVLVERGSAGVGIAKRLGLDPIEIAGTDKMLPMLAEKRAGGIIGIDLNVEAELAKRPDLAASIKELKPPLEAKLGYVIFSKSFYAKQKDLVECFWSALGRIRITPAYLELVKSYSNGTQGE